VVQIDASRLLQTECAVFIGALSRPYYSNTRQPWESSDHTSLRLLWRVFTQIRVNNSVAILHRDIWLPQLVSNHWWNGMSSANVVSDISVTVCYLLEEEKTSLNCYVAW